VIFVRKGSTVARALVVVVAFATGCTTCCSTAAAVASADNFLGILGDGAVILSFSTPCAKESAPSFPVALLILVKVFREGSDAEQVSLVGTDRVGDRLTVIRTVRKEPNY